MPIRFRCAYCNQLMGISKRKAGTVVRCPKCAGEIIVPSPEGMVQDEPPETAGGGGGPQAFEDVNFDRIISEAGDASGTAPTAGDVAPPPDLPAPAPLPPPQRLGLFLPLPTLLVSLLVIVLLLILMFVIGLIIGRHTVIVESPRALVSPLSPPGERGRGVRGLPTRMTL